jgi:hypothetical protein
MIIKNDNSLLYNDKYCKLTPTRITLKTYYPIGTSKRIPLWNIKLVEILEFDLFNPQTSLGLGNECMDIWFAGDSSRGSSARGIVITTGSSIRKGFSCENIPLLMELLG